MNKSLRSLLPLVVMTLAVSLSLSCDTGLQSEKVYSVEAETIQVTDSRRGKFNPSWSPDGRMIAFSQYDPGTSLQKYSLKSGRIESLLQEDDAYYDVKLSPDGSKIVYGSGVRNHLWVRSLQDGSDRLITPEHERAFGPIWSPDGKWIAFNFQGTLSISIWIVSAEGGAARKLTPDDHLYYCYSFSPDGEKIALYTRKSGNYEIWTVHIGTGELKQITAPPYEKRFPAWSPDGAIIAYVGYDDSCSARFSTIWLMPAIGGQARELATLEGHITQLAWSPDGASLVAQAGRLFLVSAANGKVTPLFSITTESLSWFPDSQTLLLTQDALNYSIYTVSLENKQTRKLSDRKVDLAFYPVWLNASEVVFLRLYQLWKISLSGGNSVRVGQDSTIGKSNLALSPDRSQIVFDNGYDDIYLQTLAGGPPTNLTAHIGDRLGQPAWSPDGQQIVCRYYGGLKIFALVSNKLVERKVLPGFYNEPDWSQSEAFGSIIAFENLGNIYLATLEEAEPKLAAANGQQPAWSPDGRWVAYIRESDIFITKVFDDLK